MQFGLSGRSTALKPILSADALLLVAWTALVRFHADTWIIVLVASLAALAVLVTLCAYVYFVFKNPNELRSENYLLRREELRTVRGDSLSGQTIELERPPGGDAAGGSPLIGR